MHSKDRVVLAIPLIKHQKYIVCCSDYGLCFMKTSIRLRSVGSQIHASTAATNSKEMLGVDIALFRLSIILLLQRWRARLHHTFPFPFGTSCTFISSKFEAQQFWSWIARLTKNITITQYISWCKVKWFVSESSVLSSIAIRRVPCAVIYAAITRSRTLPQ